MSFEVKGVNPSPSAKKGWTLRSLNPTSASAKVKGACGNLQLCSRYLPALQLKVNEDAAEPRNHRFRQDIRFKPIFF
ncbi:hypothetical protein CEXT_72841 [Caerostris extrusa]|uniref:Uncharacterized protein n=1 Tax=Caerostris extrusa TaxID=172846 RepID=A0AAV4S0X0_CAEEX|nr:hypothetical protein CEXT_72841 [Caerostris extrusa]